MRAHMIAVTLLSATAIVAPSVAVSGAEIKPMDGESLDLGGFHGSAYYTVQQDGYHLSITLAKMSGEKIQSEPLRFETVLPAGGSATISTPGAKEQQSIEVAFHRVGNHLVRSEGAGTAKIAHAGLSAAGHGQSSTR